VYSALKQQRTVRKRNKVPPNIQRKPNLLIEVLLDGMKSNRSDRDNARRQVHVFCPCFFGSAEKALVQHVGLQFEHRQPTIPTVPIPLDRVEYMLVEMGEMLEPAVVTILANSVFDSVVDTLAATTLR